MNDLIVAMWVPDSVYADPDPVGRYGEMGVQTDSVAYPADSLEPLLPGSFGQTRKPEGLSTMGLG